MSTEQPAGSSGGAAAAASKKHTRSRGRAKKARDPYESAHGVVPFELFRGRPWTRAKDLGEAMAGRHVLLFGCVHSVRLLSRTAAVLVLLSGSSTVICRVVAGAGEGVTTRTVRFAVTLPRQTAVDVEGVVSLPESGRRLPTSQQVEIQVTKLHSIGPPTKRQDATPRTQVELDD
ncbi:hypothetical protein ACP70R_005850 [Stipagrostis hirtigluma subsp. patula]